MNDAEFAQINDLCESYFSWWIRWMGLSWWGIKRDYYRAGFDHDHFAIPGSFIGMDTRADWQRLHAVIRVDVHAIWENEATEKQIEYMVVEELAHILIQEMHAEVPDEAWERHLGHEERVVTGLVRAFVTVNARARHEASLEDDTDDPDAEEMIPAIAPMPVDA